MYNLCIAIEDVWLKNQHVFKEITSGFGFTEPGSSQVLQQVRCSFSSEWSNDLEISPRLWLAKQIVRQCVFLVSRDMFLAKPVPGNPEQALKPFPKSLTFHKTRPMSLPVWTIYLLVDIIGFNDLEAAIILNVHPFKLREQLSIARGLVA
jgi:hypothetical protein